MTEPWKRIPAMDLKIDTGGAEGDRTVLRIPGTKFVWTLARDETFTVFHDRLIIASPVAPPRTVYPDGTV